MTIVKGVVRENIVMLEETAHLPDGAKVEVHLIDVPLTRDDAFNRVLRRST